MEEEQVTYTTTTTTRTTTQRTEVSVGFNVGFLRTPIGILIILELLLGLIAWSLLVSVWWYYQYPQLGFAAFGFIFSWIATLIIFIIFILGLHGSLCANLPWGLIQVAGNGLFAVLYFISSCCVAALGSARSNLGASAAFGFIVTVLYVISLLLCFRKAYGRFPWQTATGAPTNT